MNNYLLVTLDFGPAVMERIIARIPESRYDERSDPERFTIREIVAHLLDWEPILRERMSKLCADPGSEIITHDEGEMAITNRYSEQDTKHNLAQLKFERTETVFFLKGLSPDDWTKTGQHPHAGTLSVYDIAEMIQGHDMYHLEQLSCYLT